LLIVVSQPGQSVFEQSEIRKSEINLKSAI